MLRKGTPWLEFEQFKASDGTKAPIPEEEVAKTWNTRCNAQFADFWEWAFDAPGTAKHGTQWKWAADTSDDDGVYRFQENCIEGDIEEWSWIHNVGRNAPASTPAHTTRTGTVETIATGEKFQVRLQFAQQFLDPGQVLAMSGGERGCAHSHLRLWRAAAERPEPTLVLEDDVTFEFDRSDPELGKANGKVFTERLAGALRHVPSDFDVIYLGWSGWRGGNHKTWEKDADSAAVLNKGARKFLRRAEYVWTTVAYVISQAGAQKLLARGLPVNQPVDNYMAWEASQGRLNSYVALDQGDDDGTWAGGIVDQFDFQGDTDITKSDGGHQGHDEKEFLTAEPQ
jgi:GR25 family glycosyltransferase involved in LPS biosynthesis